MQNHSRTSNKHREHPGHDRERGQMLLVLAFAMVGLLVAAGIAVDVGVLFMRQAQLDRAVDAAALAGVIALSEDDLDAAHTRGQQLLAANGVMTTSAVNCDTVNWQPDGPNDYCGSESPGLIPGSTRYRVEALWWSETYFMPLIGFDKILITSTATAEYLPTVDVFASDTSHFGLVKTASPSTYGPNICSERGDAYIPYRELESQGGTALLNPYWDEAYGVYTYRISIPEGYEYDKVRVELFDPDGGNYYGDNGTSRDSAVRYERNGVAHTHNYIDRWLAVVDETDEFGVEGGNEYWFLNVDEYVGSGDYSDGTTCSGSHNSRMRTQSNILFRLFYYRQTTSGGLEPVDLAYYIGKAWISTSDLAGQQSNHPTSFRAPYALGGPIRYTATWTSAQAYAEAQATDLMWVSPGAPASVRMPEYDEILSTTGNPIGGGKPSGLWSPEEPATIVEPCETIRAAYYRSPENGGIDAYEGWLTNATECSATTDGDFVIDLTSEVPDIYEPPGGGGVQLYLQVTSLRGSGENVYDLWAGPTRDEDPDVAAPAYVNARHVYILNEKALDNEHHHSRGVAIYALGRMPMNMVTDSRVDVPLTYLGPEYSGLEMQIALWDADSGTTPPLTFFFDTIPQSDWKACFGTSDFQCGGTRQGYFNEIQSVWQYLDITLPSEGAGVPFYGGRLIANYQGGSQDTFTLRISLKARPFLVQ